MSNAKEMKPKIVVLVVASVLAASIGSYFWIDRKFHEAMRSNYEFKRMHVAPGTLKSISGPAPSHPPNGLQKSLGINKSTLSYTLCFTIDSFSDVPPDLQAEYAQAERSRIAREGPRCVEVSDQQPSLEGKLGEPIQVDYLLYGHGAITVERLVIRGRELLPI